MINQVINKTPNDQTPVLRGDPQLARCGLRGQSSPDSGPNGLITVESSSLTLSPQHGQLQVRGQPNLRLCHSTISGSTLQ